MIFGIGLIPLTMHLLSNKPTRLERASVVDWFGGPEALRQFHATPLDESPIIAFIGEDEA